VEVEEVTEVIKPPSFVWVYPAGVDHVHDGDTVVCHVLIHPNEGGELHEVSVRVEGINSPEMNTAEGKAAKVYAESLLSPGTQVMITARKRDKYGRFLGRLVLPNGDDFSTLMITSGHAVAYLT